MCGKDGGMGLKIGAINETIGVEKRVAVTPQVVQILKKMDLQWFIETAAGAAAGYGDHEYSALGFSVVGSSPELLANVDLVLHSAPATLKKITEFAQKTRKPLVSVGLTDFLWEKSAPKSTATPLLTSFALDLLPRITRAQSMDVLSSMSTIAGYRAVLLAAERMNKVLPMMTTAAGTIPASKFLVIGAGVAGLQAMATAKRLGAVVSGYDVRPATIEQIQSVGARAIMKEVTEGGQDAKGYATQVSEEKLKKQRELLSSVLAESDAVITTALVPGAKAPVLISSEMIHKMKPGAVIVDLAAERGGNTDLTRAAEIVVERGVHILGPVNLASAAAYHASQLFTKNVSAFIKLIVSGSQFHFDLSDEIVSATLISPRENLPRHQTPAPVESATKNEVTHG